MAVLQSGAGHHLTLGSAFKDAKTTKRSYLVNIAGLTNFWISAGCTSVSHLSRDTKIRLARWLVSW